MVGEQGTAAGWYPDPAGIHQVRYFDTRWTDQVSDGGVLSRSPLPAQPVVTTVRAAPAANYAQPYQPAAPGKPRNKRAWIGAIIGAAVLIAIIVVVVAQSGGGGNSKSASSFCTDYPKVQSLKGSDPATLQRAATLFRKLAAEAPAAAKADLTTLADDETAVLDGDAASVDNAAASAAADRVDQIAANDC